MKARLSHIARVALLAALLPAASSATTYVMMPDEALADQAEVIVQVTVEAVEPAPIAGPPSTDYFVQVERALKGYVAGSTVVVRVPGGIGPDGVGLRIWGVPEFRQGERILLFLAPRADGTYGVLHLMLGAFYEAESGGLRVAVRSLSEALELAPQAAEESGASLVEPLREFGGFVNWITDRVAGLRRPIDYYLEPLARPLRRSLETPRLLEDFCTQLNFRWFEFDRGEKVAWSFDDRGYDGRGGGRSALVRARRLWNRGGGGAVRLSSGGATSGRQPLAAFDGVNALHFNDPDEDIAGSFGCGAGGVVTLTGVWFENGRDQQCGRTSAGRKGLHEGRQYLEILGADILTNDGSACLLSADPLAASSLLAHELGHSLGLSHSGDPASLMWGFPSSLEERDGLHGEDGSALAELYPPPPQP